MVVPLTPALKRQWQEELSEFESSRPAWFTQRVPQQLGLYRKTLFQNKEPINQTKMSTRYIRHTDGDAVTKGQLSLSQASSAVSFGRPVKTRNLDDTALVLWLFKESREVQ